MSLRTILVVLLALVCGASAAVGISSLRPPAPAAPKVETVPVVVAATNITPHTTITSQALKTREYPKELVPPGALTRVEDALERVAFYPLAKDELVLNARLAPKGAVHGIAAAIPLGMRACTIQTPNVSTGVAGLIQPGHFVDVLLMVTDPFTKDQTGGATSGVLLEKVEILAVDRVVDVPVDLKAAPKDMRSVTLLVSCDDAEKLNLGQSQGKLHLVLRNPGDTTRAKGKKRTSLADLGLAPPPRKPVVETLPLPAIPVGVEQPPAPPPAQFRILRGSYEGTVQLSPVPPAGRSRPEGETSNHQR
ncbi:MAG: Flp pilus assembly protein CpaB [Gemmataceae bacterium]|nr:Flp pilus assembly protein CpaB [Gemmataceae bacterium]